MSTPANSTGPQAMPAPAIAARSLVSLAALALLLFAPTGTVTWARGWLFLAVFVIQIAAAALYLRRVNPEIYAARRRIQPGTKRWDRILLAFLFPAMLAIIPVAALDDGRFHWSRMPREFVALGYLLLTAGMAITTWAQAVNRFFEPGVRIQAERGHRVIDTGPYAFIRHPGYCAAALLFAGVALALGSWWALAPAGVATLLLVIRTAREDRTLQAELPGYSAYARRVRSRLIPGLW